MLGKKASQAKMQISDCNNAQLSRFEEIVKNRVVINLKPHLFGSVWRHACHYQIYFYFEDAMSNEEQ